MICIPIMAKDTAEAVKKIARTNPLADLLEFRLDAMESFRLPDMIQEASKPVIVTYRSRKEGGHNPEDDETRARHLLNAIENKADYVDLEYSMSPEFRDHILQNRLESKIIASVHVLDNTPSKGELNGMLNDLAGTGADIVKIVTQAQQLEDNLRVLDLIPRAKEMDLKIIALCMGEKGRISRVASLLFGAYLTFASLDQGEESADGQIPVQKMREILKVFL
ncbi:MAG: type I 3-dehydroquinate dehydratase [Deltaproteobacteria bacterium]|nr:type I 3-dehydroquinate dehydratase [Deltaproteobacteria bacterium]